MKRTGLLIVVSLFLASAYSNEVDEFWKNYDEGVQSEAVPADAMRDASLGDRANTKQEKVEKKSSEKSKEKASGTDDLFKVNIELDYRSKADFELALLLGGASQYSNVHANSSEFGLGLGYRLNSPFKKFLSRFSIGGELGLNFGYEIFDQRLSFDNLYDAGSLEGKFYTRFEVLDDLYLVSGLELFLSSKARSPEAYAIGDQKSVFFDTAWFFGVEL